MKVYPLFHWSPSDRREEILSDGLKPFSTPTVVGGGNDDLALPYISLSPTPSMAWGLSGNMGWVSEIEDWDLWQVEVPPKVETHIRPMYGDEIEEVKVYSVIPPNYIWLVGSRYPAVMQRPRKHGNKHS